MGGLYQVVTSAEVPTRRPLSARRTARTSLVRGRSRHQRGRLAPSHLRRRRRPVAGGRTPRRTSSGGSFSMPDRRRAARAPRSGLCGSNQVLPPAWHRGCPAGQATSGGVPAVHPGCNGGSRAGVGVARVAGVGAGDSVTGQRAGQYAETLRRRGTCHLLRIAAGGRTASRPMGRPAGRAGPPNFWFATSRATVLAVGKILRAGFHHCLCAACLAAIDVCSRAG